MKDISEDLTAEVDIILLAMLAAVLNAIVSDVEEGCWSAMSMGFYHQSLKKNSHLIHIAYQVSGMDKMGTTLQNLSELLLCCAADGCFELPNQTVTEPYFFLCEKLFSTVQMYNMMYNKI